ncbi:hypothetical protein KEM55_003365 [Ascosphaera atra]|nr:hypothetical protein KEM55_003365 [Ascosphaera atra]
MLRQSSARHRQSPAKGPAKVPLGPANDSAASAPSAFANAFINPADARPRSAGPASAPMRMDDVFTPRKQQQQPKSRSPTKCKPALPALVTTPLTTRKRSRQEDTPTHTSPYDIFCRPTNPVEVTLTAPPPANVELSTIMDTVNGKGLVLHSLKEAVMSIAESSRRSEGFLTGILAHMEEERQHSMENRPAEKRQRTGAEEGGEEEEENDEGEEEEERELKKVRWESKD